MKERSASSKAQRVLHNTTNPGLDSKVDVSFKEQKK